MCSSLACAGPDPLAELLLVLSVVAGIAVIAALSYIPVARETCAEERRRTRTERDAFAGFAGRIAAIEEVSPTPGQAGGGTLLAQSAPDDSSLREVRRAYQETVMGVDHFAEEYDESLSEHMAAEFDESLAVAVCGGASFSPQMRRALVQQGNEARDRRSLLLRALDRELDSLSAADETLTEVEESLSEIESRPEITRSFEWLTASWDRLRELRSECDRLVERRQEEIHEEAIARGPRGRSSLHDYLYQSLPVSHPVLADAAATLDRLDRIERGVVDGLTRRV
ncbi:DUF7260 family protein [Natronorarus salvus]|uniref:DUF7260 family protein n=1 Tax=Natronorarus salvus TaxID=3117733 RepID=UPI002F25EDDB